MDQLTLNPPVAIAPNRALHTLIKLIKPLASGLLFPLGFAPFHLPGLAILSIALLFLQIDEAPLKKAFKIGFVYGLAMLGFGVSWIYVSIHDYGHLHSLIGLSLTICFIAIFSLIPACFSLCFSAFSQKLAPLARALLFSSLWFFSEYLRGKIFGGFPWLLTGFGQMDSPLQHLFPLIGTLGVGFVAAVVASCLALTFRAKQKLVWLTLFVSLLMLPNLISSKTYTKTAGAPISVGIIQADLSMRDKWDEDLFHHIMQYYEKTANSLLKTNQLVILPESAIPMPISYASDFLDRLDTHAKMHKSAALLGIANPSPKKPGRYYNSLLGVGLARGIYFKQHLVPFGEYTPKRLHKLSEKFNIDTPNMVAGKANQPLIQYNQYPFASLICYELAFPEILRRQLPKAAFIISVSDDGWFGHSLAVFQHQQMAQVLSKQTGRYQVLANNDGLSSIINDEGQIEETLPAFTQGVLKGKIVPLTGETPWVKTGDAPVMLFNSLLLFLIGTIRLTVAAKEKRRYPNQSS